MTRPLLPATVVAMALLVPHHSLAPRSRAATSSISAPSAAASVTPSGSTTIPAPFRSWVEAHAPTASPMRSSGRRLGRWSISARSVGATATLRTSTITDRLPAAARTRPGSGGPRSGNVRAAHGPLRTSALSQARAAPMPTGSTTEPPAIRPQLPSWVAAPSARAPATPRCGQDPQADGPFRRSAPCQVTRPAPPMM